MITTVYDKPEETDPGDTLKRTNPQNYLSYRKSWKWWAATRYEYENIHPERNTIIFVIYKIYCQLARINKANQNVWYSLKFVKQPDTTLLVSLSIGIGAFASWTWRCCKCRSRRWAQRTPTQKGSCRRLGGVRDSSSICYAMVFLSFHNSWWMVYLCRVTKSVPLWLAKCSVYTALLFFKNCFKVKNFDKIYFFLL